MLSFATQHAIPTKKLENRSILTRGFEVPLAYDSVKKNKYEGKI